MKNILITIVFGLNLVPILVYSQTNTMYFCCSHIGGGCSPVGYTTATACKAACSDTQYCDVRSVGTATAIAPVAPVGYSAGYPGYMGYGMGYAPVAPVGIAPVNTATVETAVNTMAQVGAVPSAAPVTTTAAGLPVQAAVPGVPGAGIPVAVGAPGAVTGTPALTTGTPIVPSANTIGTGTAATTMYGNQVR